MSSTRETVDYVTPEMIQPNISIFAEKIILEVSQHPIIQALLRIIN